MIDPKTKAVEEAKNRLSQYVDRYHDLTDAEVEDALLFIWDEAMQEVVSVYTKAWDEGNPLSPHELEKRLRGKEV